MKKIADYVISHYKIVLAIVIILSVPLAVSFARQKFHNHVDIYFDAEDPDLLFYKRFQKTYGNEELGVIVFKCDDIFTPKNLAIVRDISKKLRSTEGIQRVFSLTETKEPVGRNDTIAFENIIPDADYNTLDLAAVKRRALANKTIGGNIISADGKTTAILFELVPLHDNEQKRRILLSVMEAARAIAGDAVQLRFAGVPIVEVEMNTLSRKDFLSFTPITFVLIFLVVWLMLRKISLSALCQVNLLTCLVWGIGFFSLAGETFNIVTTVMAPILLAISVADSIHILAHFREMYKLNGGNHVAAVHNTVRNVWLPCLFTSITTMAGFASFATSSIRPVRVMGVFTAIGVGFAFLLTMLFIPSVLMLLKKRLNLSVSSNDVKSDLPPSEIILKSDRFMNILLSICNFTVEHNRAMMAALAIIFIFSIYGMMQLKFETNTMNYLPPSNPIRQDITFIEENMGGTIPFVMLFTAKNPNKDFTQPESIKLLDEIQTHLRTVIPQFTHAFSIVDYFKEVHKAFNNGDEAFRKIPESRRDVLDYYELGEADVLDRIVSPNRREARISFLSRWDTNETAQRTHKYIVEYMAKTLGNDFTYKITGLSSMYLNMEFKLKASQRNSFIVALCIIFVMMYMVCRKFYLTSIAMIPNILPIAMTMGLMGWLNIPLDVSTIMIASVTLGIAVDDTIHLITWYTRNIAISQNRKEALLKTFRDVGKPVVITSVVLFMGFFVLILGTIKPTKAFGVLTAFSMLFALIGDLIFLPALLVFFKPKMAKADRDFLNEFNK